MTATKGPYGAGLRRKVQFDKFELAASNDQVARIAKVRPMRGGVSQRMHYSVRGCNAATQTVDSPYSPESYNKQPGQSSPGSPSIDYAFTSFNWAYRAHYARRRLFKN